MHAARTLGAGPLRALLTVHLPLAAPGLVAGAMLGFARALGDFGVTLMVAGNIPGHTQTAALAIYDAIQAQRDDQAAALALVLASLAVAIMYVANRLTPRRPCRALTPLSVRVRVERRRKDAFLLDVAFDVPPGITVLVGPSGCGKSTTLAAIAGNPRADVGTRGTSARGMVRLDRANRPGAPSPACVAGVPVARAVPAHVRPGQRRLWRPAIVVST